eukprot:3938644-Rhodomonas_salina.4
MWGQTEAINLTTVTAVDKSPSGLGIFTSTNRESSKGEYAYGPRICLAWVYSSFPGLGPDCVLYGKLSPSHLDSEARMDNTAR